jgi:hypothetical protein
MLTIVRLMAVPARDNDGRHWRGTSLGLLEFLLQLRISRISDQGFTHGGTSASEAGDGVRGDS